MAEGETRRLEGGGKVRRSGFEGEIRRGRDYVAGEGEMLRIARGKEGGLGEEARSSYQGRGNQIVSYSDSQIEIAGQKASS